MPFWETFYELCIKNNTRPNPVAKELGFSSAAVTQWKKGTVPSSKSAAKIAAYFNISVDQLLGGNQSGCDKLSAGELEHIKKYRSLDDMGAKAVDALLDIEYERCGRGSIRVSGKIAARSDEGISSAHAFPDDSVIAETEEIID
ncbi:MAG: helix-turn-helix transcriptional regulator [Ruminococcus sp.]|nr:helix-turn-helix transcriptional regulator [Ruminococcus sp.]